MSFFRRKILLFTVAAFLGLQCLIPRGLVLCVPHEGEVALELSAAGRCFAPGSSDAAPDCKDCLNPVESTQHLVAAIGASLTCALGECCKDHQLSFGEARRCTRPLATAQLPRIEAVCLGSPAAATSMLVLTASNWQSSGYRCCGPPLLLTGTVLLRI